MPTKVTCAVLAIALAAGACADDGQDDEVLAIEGSLDAKTDGPVAGTLRRVASPSSGLSAPADLAFNPRRRGELWVVNYADDSVVIVKGATTTSRRPEYRKDGYALHFMANPTSIDFGADWTSFGVPGTFATCGDSRNTYNDMAPHNDFMGPSLWSSDLSIFARLNPYGLGSHIDMMHETPQCMGIAHETANVYWAVGGLYGGIYRYDFQRDHNVGQDDHSDGKVWMYAIHTLRRVPGVPSHVVFDPADKALYVADTGHSRVIKLDTATGREGPRLPSPEPLRGAIQMLDASVTEVVPASSRALVSPSGLELKDGELWVSDNATGRISVFTKTGTRKRYYDTRLPDGSLAGMAFGPDGKLYLVDMMADRVLRLDPPAAAPR